MARVNAQQWLQKWGQNLSAAGQAIQNGVSRVQQAPGVSAAQAADRYAAGVQKAVANGTWQNNVSKVSLQSWQQSMVSKGIPRLAQGIAAAQANKQAKVTQLLNAVDTAVAAANQLPRGSIEQNIARSAAFARAMSQAAPKNNPQ
jgi:hypothetical protein